MNVQKLLSVTQNKTVKNSTENKQIMEYLYHGILYRGKMKSQL